MYLTDNLPPGGRSRGYICRYLFQNIETQKQPPSTPTHPGPGALPPIYKHHALKRTPLVRLFSIKLRTIYAVARGTRSHTPWHTRAREGSASAHITSRCDLDLVSPAH